MGIRSNIQTKLSKVMLDQLSDIVSNFNFIIETQQTSYDVNSDSYNTLEKSSLSKGIFTTFGLNELDENVKIDDEKLIVNGADILNSLIPKVGMIIELENKTRYKIVNSSPITGGGTLAIIYELHVRKDAERVQR